jgi:hypothetical protein
VRLRVRVRKLRMLQQQLPRHLQIMAHLLRIAPLIVKQICVLSLTKLNFVQMRLRRQRLGDGLAMERAAFRIQRGRVVEV